MTTKTSIIFHTDNLTAKDMQNALRRFVASGIEVPESGEVKFQNMTIKTREVARVPFENKKKIREWLAGQGHAEVVGKRGRIAADLLKQYEEAHA